MCGIIGYVGSNSNAQGILKEGLLRLEYRGYDSAGMALLSENEIIVHKDVGYVSDALSGMRQFDSRVGIAHTRWATHGGASRKNAHPHTSCNEEVAVVHNGVIENFLKLRSELSEKGHTFISDTDTEVIAHLIEEELKRFGNSEDAFSNTISKLEGSFAIAAIINRDPRVFIARNRSPLVVGYGKGEMLCASDFSPMVSRTKTFLPLKDGDFGYLSENGLFLLNRNVGNGDFVIVDWDVETASKSGHPHFTLKEIYEEKEIPSRSFSPIPFSITDLGHKLDIVAAGTSYHAALYLQNLLLNKGVDARAYIASEYSQDTVGDYSRNALFISQSGETADVLESLRFARDFAERIFAVSNVVGSTLSREADVCAYINAGPEISVQATKSFVAQLCVFSNLVHGKTYLADVEKSISFALGLEKKIFEVAERIRSFKHMFVLARGNLKPIGMEASLKLKECSYTFSEFYPSGELKHGPLALVDEGVCCLVLSRKGWDSKKTIGTIKEVKSRGSTVVTISDDPSLSEVSDMFIPAMNQDNPELSPFSFIVQCQLLAYRKGVLSGINPDRPRNLAKSVTVE